jgi:hypothetical protein
MFERLQRDGEHVRREIYLLDLEDDGAYVGRCDKGHEIRVALQNLRYEILYESGIVALHVGFHREAVSSIASALERFYEFAIRVFLTHSGLDDAAIDEEWKQVANQSERQFGAVAFLYLGVIKETFVPPKRSGSIPEVTTFRNEVVHKGKIPTRVHAIEYARHVYDIVLAMRAKLVALDPDAVRLVEHRMGAFANRRALDKKAGPPKPTKDGLYSSGSTAFVSTMLSDLDAGRDKRFAYRFVQSATSLDLWGLGGIPLRPESEAVRRALGMCDHRLCEYLEDHTRCCFRDVDSPQASDPVSEPIDEARWTKLRAEWDQLKASPDDNWDAGVATELARAVRNEVLARNRPGSGALLKDTTAKVLAAFGEKSCERES